MHYYRRKLPHWFPDQAPIFLTWRLADSPPPELPAILTAENTGRVPTHQPPKRTGAQWLKDPRIAKIIADAIAYGETSGSYRLHAWVIMATYVHMIIDPMIPVPEITRWLKSRTARVANRILNLTGAFWQAESYDHWVRSSTEIDYLIDYIESNPVKAGLAARNEDYPWSSARSAGDEKRSPTLQTP